MYKVMITILIALFILIPAAAASETAPSAEPMLMNGHPACGGVTYETPSTPECEALIASRPTPNVTRVPVDFGIVSDKNFIRFNKNNVPIYDAPNGKVVETMVTGYTYVVPIDYQDGFAKLSANRWVSLEDARFASPSDFSGVLINGGLDMPFAWVLWDHDAVKSPNGLTDRENGHYHRYQLVNIYATVNVSGWDWHLVGSGHWINQKNLSIVYPTAPAEFPGNWVAVNLFEQNLVAYSGGAPMMATLVSSGVKNGEWDTNPGTFSVHTRIEAGKMSGAEGGPDYYSLDLVPYAQYFDNLISLHGTYWHDGFGYTHSHGCVNLSISDSKWLYGWIGEGSTVYVYDRE